MSDHQLAAIASMLDDIRGYLLVIAIVLLCISVGVCNVAKNTTPDATPTTGKKK